MSETILYILRLRPRLLYSSLKIWDWDWDFRNQSQILILRLRLCPFGLKRWDWDWDFDALVSKLETETETTLVSVSVSRPKSRSSLHFSMGVPKTRVNRWKQSRFASDREVFEEFNNNCGCAHQAGANLAVDECLYWWRTQVFSFFGYE